MSTVELHIKGDARSAAELLFALFNSPIQTTLEVAGGVDRASVERTSSSSPASKLQTPAIGQPWPGQGGIYAGISRGVDGQPDAHLILAPIKPEGTKNWDSAASWAAAVSIDGHSDFRLPTRAEGHLLIANLKDQFEAHWYWLGEQYSRDLAWHQYFDDGGQGLSGKSYGGRARAVRRFIA